MSGLTVNIGDEYVVGTQRETVVLVDGFGLIFRAYFALPPTLSTASGEQTNAVLGFTSMLLDVMNLRKPDYAIVALDVGKTFRHDLYPEYKGTRAKMPEDLKDQIARVREVIEVLGIPVCERENYEADDVIGSLAHTYAAAGKQVVIVTGDSDLLQLVEENVLVVLPGARRFGDVREFDTAAVLERYGFGPEYIPDYKSLLGDTSDNIPGVPGIGEKTAAALISKFGGLEEIIAHQDEITPTRAKNAMAENHEQARKSKHLATIVRDLDIEPDPEKARFGDFDRDAVTELFRTLEFRNLLTKLPSPKDDTEILESALVDRPDSVQTLVTTVEQLAALIEAINTTREIALDVETTSTEPLLATLVGIAIATTPNTSFYVPVGHNSGEQLSLDLVRSKLDPVIANPDIAMYTHHGKYDLHVMIRHGFSPRAITFDTMVAAYLLGESKIGLKDLSFIKLGIQMTEISELIGTGRLQATMDTVDVELAAPYACGDVESTFSLVAPLRTQLEKRDQMPLLETIELPLASVLIEMERAGIAINEDELAAFSVELGHRIDEIVTEIDTTAGRPINVGSNKQLATILFEELGLPSGRKTKTGYSVDSEVLEGLRDQHPIVPLVLELRTLAKLKSTYVDALPVWVNPETGRVHTSYNQTVAATGRLASQNPNLQNIPIRTEIGRRVRKSFVADHRPERQIVESAELLAADYSQMELRILAHMSQEPFLIEAFRNGEDIHRATAALVNNIDISEVTTDHRRIAKTVNFGILYGMQAFGLSRDTGMSRSDAQEFINGYWERLPKVKKFFDETIEFGVVNGYVETLSGRRRYLPELTASNQARRMGAQRVAMNMPIQGTQADIIKIAMIQLQDELVKRELPARMLLQVHDELVLEIDSRQRDVVAELLKSTMENAYSLDVPIVVEAKVGQNWEEMTELV
jgi:DNA polymerase-1